jgi:hypothetical protein
MNPVNLANQCFHRGFLLRRAIAEARHARL